jgi:hypothetical protein
MEVNILKYIHINRPYIHSNHIKDNNLLKSKTILPSAFLNSQKCPYVFDLEFRPMFVQVKTTML